MDNVETLLTNEIEALMEHMGTLSPESKEYNSCTENLTKLESALAEHRRTNAEIELKSDANHAEQSAREREVTVTEKQYKSDKIRSYIEIGLGAVAKAVTVVSFVALGGRMLESEQTGSLTSKLMPSIIRFFTPMK